MCVDSDLLDVVINREVPLVATVCSVALCLQVILSQQTISGNVRGPKDESLTRSGRHAKSPPAREASIANTSPGPVGVLAQQFPPVPGWRRSPEFECHP